MRPFSLCDAWLIFLLNGGKMFPVYLAISYVEGFL